MPSFNEGESIYDSIKAFEALNIFSNIIVIDNNSSDNSKEEIIKTKAKYISETKQGYGYALRRGFLESKSDIVVTCEPDGTFSARDVFKLIAYSYDFDCVFGTRTSRAMIKKNAKMNFYLRYGNILFAKILEYLFNGPSLTDVGCTFKLFNKKSVDLIKNKLTVGTSHIQPEIMIQLIFHKLKVIEIPVFYLERKGYSKITYNFNSSLIVAIKMALIILKLRLISLVKKI